MTKLEYRISHLFIGLLVGNANIGGHSGMNQSLATLYNCTEWRHQRRGIQSVPKVAEDYRNCRNRRRNEGDRCW